MASRASWKGYLRLNLVSCAVGLYSATTSTSRLTCHTLNRQTGNRIRELVVDAETGDPVEREDRIRGCAMTRKDDFVPLEESELDAIRLESTHTITIEQFVPAAGVDQRYYDKPYYLAPEDKVSREAFAVIRDAMRDRKVVGLGRLVIWRRERIVLLEPWEQGMLATLLRHADEVRPAASVLAEIGSFDAPPEMRDLAGALIDRALGEFTPDAFVDRYEEALVKLVESKSEGRQGRSGAESKPVAVPASSGGLMEALRRSLQAGKGEEDRPKPANEDPPKSRSRKAEPAEAETDAEEKPKPRRRAASGSRREKEPAEASR